MGSVRSPWAGSLLLTALPVSSGSGLGQMPSARGPWGQTLGRLAPKGCTQSFVWLKPFAAPLDLSFHLWKKWG